ncbi:MAG: hypothetical protein EXQ56_09015 [Acidobacteria bacterium]|nr:hypothetical protein [Acidobacteriota bacterium]
MHHTPTIRYWFHTLLFASLILVLAHPRILSAAESAAAASDAANQVVPGQIQFSGNVLTAEGAEDTEVKA